ncbi:hypothetical protein C8Q76DRAFT_219356 [Earliella scabrosa]|nr:hypothetical protein C8Q76DRAFT_219356 [Earliella scabrosa]
MTTKSVGHPQDPLAVLSTAQCQQASQNLTVLHATHSSFLSISFPGTASLSFHFETLTSLWAALLAPVPGMSPWQTYRPPSPFPGSRPTNDGSSPQTPISRSSQSVPAALLLVPAVSVVLSAHMNSRTRLLVCVSIPHAAQKLRHRNGCIDRRSVSLAQGAMKNRKIDTHVVAQYSYIYVTEPRSGQISNAPGRTLLSLPLQHSPRASSCSSCPQAPLALPQTFAEWSGTTYWYGIPPGASLFSDPGWFTRLAS